MQFLLDKLGVAVGALHWLRAVLPALIRLCLHALQVTRAHRLDRQLRMRRRVGVVVAVIAVHSVMVKLSVENGVGPPEQKGQQHRCAQQYERSREVRQAERFRKQEKG